MTQALRRWIVWSVALTCAACSSGPSNQLPAPLAPERTITEFMTAVRGNDLRAMAALWGTRRGPARMDSRELQMRLTVMQRYLSHDQYEVMPDIGLGSNDPNVRRYRLRLTRQGCQETVPVELVDTGSGWLVTSVDLTQAGNPARACEAGQGRR